MPSIGAWSCVLASNARCSSKLLRAKAKLALAIATSSARGPALISATAAPFAACGAEAKHAANGAAVALINAGPRAEDVAIAKANLALARSNLEEQRALLAKTQLHAPIDGIVLRRYLRTGEVTSIQPPTPILEVGDTS